MLQIQCLEGAKVPVRGSDGSAGYDLYSMEDFKICSEKQTLISTGIKMKIPKNHVGFIKSRSSLSYKHGLCVEAGVIDSDYRGEIKVLLHNYGKETYKGKKGDKIAQIVIMPCLMIKTKVVKSLDETKRGNKGFGSTGK